MMLAERLKSAFFTALVAGVLALPLAGARTVDGLNGLMVEWHLTEVGIACVMIFFGRLLLDLIGDGQGGWIAPLAFVTGIVAAYLPFPSHFLHTVSIAGSFVIAARAAYVLVCGLRKADTGKMAWAKKLKNYTVLSYLLILFAVALPFLPFTSRYMLDVGIMVLTYIMLAWGLNITVGYAGLLDLGYAGFYALGAYCYALLAQDCNIGFWTALPIAAALTATAALLLGLPVLRLRGDYFAIVTLGFGEIVRLVLTNWVSFTSGPNGISGIPHPTLFGLQFDRVAEGAHKTFSDYFGIAFDPIQRVIFTYYVILMLALLVGWFSTRLRRLPIGRAWEAFREDEIACASLGINRWKVKLAAYSLGAMVAGIGGVFFASSQSFVSPESFTFTESATMLAIVILGGVGHPLGIVLAALFIIGMPELFREFEQYRMLAFGVGMVLIMIWRPGGLMARREPTVELPQTATP